jgi:hypothetical protein
LIGGLTAELAFLLHLAGRTLPLLFGASVGLAAIVGLLCACAELFRPDPVTASS